MIRAAAVEALVACGHAAAEFDGRSDAFVFGFARGRLDGSPDQPRDEHGRWGEGGGDSALHAERAEHASAVAHVEGTSEAHHTAAEAHDRAAQAFRHEGDHVEQRIHESQANGHREQVANKLSREASAASKRANTANTPEAHQVALDAHRAAEVAHDAIGDRAELSDVHAEKALEHQSAINALSEPPLEAAPHYESQSPMQTVEVPAETMARGHELQANLVAAREAAHAHGVETGRAYREFVSRTAKEAKAKDAAVRKAGRALQTWIEKTADKHDMDVESSPWDVAHSAAGELGGLGADSIRDILPPASEVASSLKLEDRDGFARDAAKPLASSFQREIESDERADTQEDPMDQKNRGTVVDALIARGHAAAEFDGKSDAFVFGFARGRLDGSPDQPRDELGRWGEGGSGGASAGGSNGSGSGGDHAALAEHASKADAHHVATVNRVYKEHGALPYKASAAVHQAVAEHPDVIRSHLEQLQAERAVSAAHGEDTTDHDNAIADDKKALEKATLAAMPPPTGAPIAGAPPPPTEAQYHASRIAGEMRTEKANSASRAAGDADKRAAAEKTPEARQAAIAAHQAAIGEQKAVGDPGGISRAHEEKIKEHERALATKAPPTVAEAQHELRQRDLATAREKLAKDPTNARAMAAVRSALGPASTAEKALAAERSGTGSVKEAVNSAHAASDSHMQALAANVAGDHEAAARHAEDAAGHAATARAMADKAPEHMREGANEHARAAESSARAAAQLAASAQAKAGVGPSVAELRQKADDAEKQANEHYAAYAQLQASGDKSRATHEQKMAHLSESTRLRKEAVEHIRNATTLVDRSSKAAKAVRAGKASGKAPRGRKK